MQDYGRDYNKRNVPRNVIAEHCKVLKKCLVFSIEHTSIGRLSRLFAGKQQRDERRIYERGEEVE